MRFDQNTHTDYATLVLVADREADAGTAAGVRRHSDICPECRARMIALRATINEFDAAYSERVDSPFAAAEGPRARLKTQLSKMATKPNRLSWRHFFYIPVPVMRRGYLTSAVAAIALTAMISFSVFTPAVSAKEFLVRASAAQSARGSRARLLSIRLQGKDFNSQSEELQRRGRNVFAKARLDWDDPLSPAAFTRWHDSVHEKSDEVTRQTGRLTLRTTTKADPVEEASYTVEDHTWLPVSETVTLRDGTNIEITAVPNLSASQVDAPASDLSGLPDSKPVPTPEIAPALESSLSRVNETTVDDSEVLARVALHTVGAEEGGQVEFHRLGANLLSVNTLVESEERRRSLTTALAAIPRVRPEIRTFAEAAAKSSGPVQRPAPDMAVAAAAIPAFQHELETLFPDAGSREALVNSVLTESQRASAEAWQTGLLVRRYGEGDVNKLSPPAREALEELIREHLDALSQAVQQISVRIKPLMEVPQPDREADPPVKPWREELLLLTQTALSMHVEIQEALIASSGSRNAEQLRAAIISALQWLEGGLEAARRETRQHFLKNEGNNQTK